MVVLPDEMFLENRRGHPVCEIVTSYVDSESR